MNPFIIILIIMVVVLGLDKYLHYRREHTWTKLNDMYDVNGNGSIHLNYNRAFNSETWKEMMEAMHKLPRNKDGNIELQD